MDKVLVETAEKAERALEKDLNRAELQRILGYVNIGLAIAHDSGVSIGHFGCGDFIQLAQTVNGVLLRAIPPAAGCGPEGARTSDVDEAPAVPATAV